MRSSSFISPHEMVCKTNQASLGRIYMRSTRLVHIHKPLFHPMSDWVSAAEGTNEGSKACCGASEVVGVCTVQPFDGRLLMCVSAFLLLYIRGCHRPWLRPFVHLTVVSVNSFVHLYFRTSIRHIWVEKDPALFIQSVRKNADLYNVHSSFSLVTHLSKYS